MLGICFLTKAIPKAGMGYENVIRASSAYNMFYKKSLSSLPAEAVSGEAPPPVQGGNYQFVKREVDIAGRSYGTGRRKSSVARVWVKEGSGEIMVNNKSFIDYFQPMQRFDIVKVFTASLTAGKYDVWCTVKGGGISGQAGAVRLGIARALEKQEPHLRAALRPQGMLTRDSRRVERKKPGQKKARKKFQWVKR